MLSSRQEGHREEGVAAGPGHHLRVETLLALLRRAHSGIGHLLGSCGGPHGRRCSDSAARLHAPRLSAQAGVCWVDLDGVVIVWIDRLQRDGASFWLLKWQLLAQHPARLSHPCIASTSQPRFTELPGSRTIRRVQKTD